MVGAGGTTGAGRRGSSILRAVTALSDFASLPGKNLSGQFASAFVSTCAENLLLSNAASTWDLGKSLGTISQMNGVGISQEIPVHFTDETGWPFEEQCALVTSISFEKEWPLQVRRLPDVRGGISAVSVGAGWANFLADQNVGFGALMTFEVVDERRLVVALHHRRSPEDTEKTDIETGLVRVCRGGNLPEVMNTRPTTLTALPEFRGDVRPQFRKTLRKTHVLKHASSRIVSAHPCCRA